MNRITRAARRAGVAAAVLRAAALLNVGAVWPGRALAAAAGTPFAAPVAPALSGPTGGLLRVVVSLGLVLAAVAAAAWLLRRMRGLGGVQGRAIELLAQVSLGTRERVVLVRVGGHELLLGVAAGSVRTLLVLGDSVAAAADAAARAAGQARPSAAAPAAGAPPSFAATLRTVLARSLGR